MDKGEKVRRELKQKAKEWERKGWLHKYRDAIGHEYWALTPLGRRKLGLPALLTQQH